MCRETFYDILYLLINRLEFFNSVISLCESQDFSPILTSHILPSFLLSEADDHHLTMEGLPEDEHSLFNACIMTCPYTSLWPLVVDPLGMTSHWLKKREMSNGVVFVDYEVRTTCVNILLTVYS